MKTDFEELKLRHFPIIENPCPEFENLIYREIEQSLSEKENKKLNAHFEKCPKCLEFYYSLLEFSYLPEIKKLKKFVFSKFGEEMQEKIDAVFQKGFFVVLVLPEYFLLKSAAVPKEFEVFALDAKNVYKDEAVELNVYIKTVSLYMDVFIHKKKYSEFSIKINNRKISSYEKQDNKIRIELIEVYRILPKKFYNFTAEVSVDGKKYFDNPITVYLQK